jgi:hypothetical protein
MLKLEGNEGFEGKEGIDRMNQYETVKSLRKK